MTVSVTSDLTDVSAANTLTDGGQFYKLNGTASGNPAADSDAHIQGSGCVANKMGATSGATDVGGHFNHTTTFDLTGKHIFHWRQIVTAGNMAAKASLGITIGLTNTSTTSTTTWSTTNFKQWYLDGSDTVPSAIGWICYVVDPTSTANNSAGTLTLNSVKNAGFICRQTSAVTTTLSNQFVDSIRMGTGVIGTASSAADTITLQNIYDTDKTNTNSWGIITQTAGIFYGAGTITVGSITQTNTCAFTDSSQVLVWRNFPVSTSLYNINLLGASGYTTTFQITGYVIRGQSGKTWNITCGSFTNFKAYSSSLSHLLGATLSSGSVLNGCTLASCGAITTNGATITGCTFTPPTATNQLTAAIGAATTAITNNSFTSGGTGHGLIITGAPANQTLTGLSWANYAATNGSTGNESVYINTSAGSMDLNISGGTVPSIRVAAGVTVNVVSSVAVTFNKMKDNSEVRIYATGTSTQIDGIENATAGTTDNRSFTWSAAVGTGVDYVIHNFLSGATIYKSIRVNGYTVPSLATTIDIQQQLDRNCA